MQLIPQVLFSVLLLTSVALFARSVKAIRRNILLGQDEDLSDRKDERWKNLLLLAFGQKKMFRKPLVALMHFVIYAGFIIINIEVAEIVLDGILGTHRLFAPALGGLYPVLINIFELLAFGVLAVCIVFLCRRNIVYVKRLWSKELNGWPKSDANLILITEIVLMLLFLTMNSADTLLQQRGAGEYAEHVTGNFWVSSLLHPLLNGLSDQGLIVLERVCWWLHIAGILAFLNYLPVSKHLHILLAFPNAYYTRLEPKGMMKNMPEIQKEVLYAMAPETAPTGGTENTVPKKFGARDVTDLTWKNLLDAYSCTECGRCTAACPANQTGKLLSPRKIMMDTRDRMEQVGKNLDAKLTVADDEKVLLRGYISEEELRACTTCQACVEECPVGIDPLDIILQLRRYMVMEESSAPQEWNMMFSNVENNFAPWKFSPDARDQWVNEMPAK
jgi:heterodisulfide reductase subunit C